MNQAEDLAELFGPSWGWVRLSLALIAPELQLNSAVCRLASAAIMASLLESSHLFSTKSKQACAYIRAVLMMACVRSYRSAIELVSNDSFWLS